MAHFTENDLGELFASEDNNTIYKVVGYVEAPSVILRNLITGEEERITVNSITAKEFKRIEIKED